MDKRKVKRFVLWFFYPSISCLVLSLYAVFHALAKVKDFQEALQT
jgi:hypothetical protein